MIKEINPLKDKIIQQKDLMFVKKYLKIME
jgi:hypothetical protein